MRNTLSVCVVYEEEKILLGAKNTAVRDSFGDNI